MPYQEQRVTSVHRWSEKTFTFTTTRPEGFQFKDGEFVTLGLRDEGKLIARAYSIASSNDTEHLEFLSIHVPDGPLTSRLARVREGESVWVNTKPTGSLTVNHVLPGRHLYLLATGTGLAPFMSLVRGRGVYERFERVILVHSVRTVVELAYRAELESRSGDKLVYVPTVTREPFETPERGADLFRSGALFERLGLPPADMDQDRVMLCGNPHMNREMKDYLESIGGVMTNYKGVGSFTVEQAFVLHHAGD
ncbi:ferredoxin-NADP reductase [Thioalkalivibrio sulfidiphilus HL-EbGr7]|uniref:ferredoxin--NADP(+) reductase n=1 Tax=Thioalkalivibrio sulfidiphilus (strain HL-EbGR7) TaxID=396588 RepID=B8GT99_THISH|nr:ferredoxin--NADP reductase [Thioalkalivibrio sulfidiphilus]ACL71159.1 ferredoxin-NADP reductase [Thioalkalivibrio sulfidiphilus HL-EbGr7]